MPEATASPIKREVRNVFIPVSDVHRASRWFRDVLGLPAQEVVAGPRPSPRRRARD